MSERGWTLRLAGPPAVQRGAQSVPLPFERSGQLVALLALRRDWVPRAELAALLWPDVPRPLASTNLRKALFRLRGQPWAEGLEADGALLRVAAPTDVETFAALQRAGRLADALAAASGELLIGFDDDANEAWTEWLRSQRERWRGAWRAAALQRLAEPLPPEEGLALAAALLEADPLDEAALQVQLTLLAQAGQAGRARELYRAFAQRLEQELGLPPGDALRALHDGLQPRPPAAPAPAPRADDGYVGRAFEQRRIAELMARADCRLLAIVGPGGIGKTRLARRVLDDVAPLFADGALFVPLEDLGEAAALPARLLQALGVVRHGAHDAHAVLLEHLRERRLLLVLDNLEPLTAAATPLLETLLGAAPALKIIVTSRERLALGAQWALPLDGLPCPEPEDADRLESFDAARLFIAAARRADPQLDAWAERAAIVAICRQVDGLPLALELAAAWTRVMPCEEIARELREGTELLRSTNPAFPARQASLEAVFEQSWRLIGERERQALARLSVCRGGFTVEAARAVTGAPLPVLGALTDKSLLHKDGARLALHPLVQQFAALRLADVAEQAAARSAHARHFLALLEQHRAGLNAGDADALRRIDDEFENCRLAWRWLAEHGPADALAAAARTLSDHADHRGQAQRWLELLEQALAAPPAAADAALRARLLAHAAHHAYRLDRFDAAEALARQSLDTAPRADPQRRETQRMAQQVLGAVALRLGRLADARPHFRAVLELGGASGATRDRAVTLDHLALIEKRLGRLDEALQLSHESLALHRRGEQPAALALCLNNLGSLHLLRREPDAAEAPLHEALALCERAGLSATLTLVLANLCDAALARGDLASAERHGNRAAESAIATGQRIPLGWVRAFLATAALRRGAFDAARVALAEAGEIALASGSPTLKAVVALAAARLLHASGDAAAARRALAAAAADSSLGPADRDGLQRQLADWGGAEPGPAPGLPLDTLLQRVVLEAADAHAALRAWLTG